MEKRIVRAAPAQPRAYHRRFAVLCPVCGARVCDISTKSRIEQYAEDDEGKPPCEPDVYVKCTNCKSELALYKKTE